MSKPRPAPASPLCLLVPMADVRAMELRLRTATPDHPVTTTELRSFLAGLLACQHRFAPLESEGRR